MLQEACITVWRSFLNLQRFSSYFFAWHNAMIYRIAAVIASHHTTECSVSQFYSFLERKGETHGPWKQSKEGKMLEIALLASLDVNYNVLKCPCPLPSMKGTNIY